MLYPFPFHFSCMYDLECILSIIQQTLPYFIWSLLGCNFWRIIYLSFPFHPHVFSSLLGCMSSNMQQTSTCDFLSRQCKRAVRTDGWETSGDVQKYQTNSIQISQWKTPQSFQSDTCCTELGTGKLYTTVVINFQTILLNHL